MKTPKAIFVLGMWALLAPAGWAQDKSPGNVAREPLGNQKVGHPCPPERACDGSHPLDANLSDQQLETEQHYQAKVRPMIDGSRFDSLDKEADRVRTSKERAEGGAWKLYLLYDFVSEPMTGDSATEFEWTSRIDQLKNWVAARPQSVTAHIALAKAYLGYAWFARGSTGADGVSDSDWNLFGARLSQASDMLKEAEKLPTKCPEFYHATLLLARDQGWSLDSMREVFERAIAFEPAYYHNYREFDYTLMPQWFGQEGDAEAFAEESARRIGGHEGDFVYFELASLIYCQCGTPPEHPTLSWPKIQGGFAVLEAKYGASTLKLNRFAALAYLYKDRTVAKRALERVGDNWDISAWGKRSTFDAAKEWAQPDPTAVEHIVPAGIDPRVEQWQADFTAAFNSRLSNQFENGEVLYRKALNEAEQISPLPEGRRALPTTLQAFGSFYMTQRKYSEAERLFRRNIEVCEQQGSKADLQTQNARQSLVTMYRVSRDDKSAEAIAQEMVEIAEQNPPAGNDPYISQALDLLGGIYYSQLQFAKAQPLYERALALDEKLQGPDSIMVASRLDSLAALYRAEGAFEKAEPVFRRELDLNELHYGKSSAAVQGSLAQLVDLMKKMGRREEAAQYQERWDAIEKSHAQP